MPYFRQGCHVLGAQRVSGGKGVPFVDLSVSLKDIQGLARHTHTWTKIWIHGPVFFPSGEAYIAVRVHLTGNEGPHSSPLTPFTITQHASWAPNMPDLLALPQGLVHTTSQVSFPPLPPHPSPSIVDALLTSLSTQIARPFLVWSWIHRVPHNFLALGYICQRACLILFPCYLMLFYVFLPFQQHCMLLKGKDV